MSEIDLANQSIAKEVAECLNKHYPGHAWAVTANVETGLVQVRNLKLSGKLGFILKMDDMSTDPGMRLVIRAGGEILERYRLSRRGINESEMSDIQYDFKGEAIQS